MFNAADQLTSGNGRSYTYYMDGSLRADTGMGPNRTYQYTSAGLLSRADDSWTLTYLTNSWDGDGNRVGLVVNGEGYTFVYDLTAGIPAVVEEITPSGTNCYYREPDGSLVARRQGLTGSDWRYYHFDEIGSTRLLTDLDGMVTDSYAYDAWGNLIDRTGDTEQPYQYVGRLGYYTHYQDSAFNLLQLGVRFYDPEIGRFTERDPESQGWEDYAYAGSRPLSMVDPSGKWTLEDCDIWYKECLDQAGWEFINCITPGALEASAAAGIDLAALCGLGVKMGNPYVIGACIVVALGDAIGFVLLWNACNDLKDILVEGCESAYDFCKKNAGQPTGVTLRFGGMYGIAEPIQLRKKPGYPYYAVE